MIIYRGNRIYEVKHRRGNTWVSKRLRSKFQPYSTRTGQFRFHFHYGRKGLFKKRRVYTVTATGTPKRKTGLVYRYKDAIRLTYHGHNNYILKRRIHHKWHTTKIRSTVHPIIHSRGGLNFNARFNYRRWKNFRFYIRHKPAVKTGLLYQYKNHIKVYGKGGNKIQVIRRINYKWNTIWLKTDKTPVVTKARNNIYNVKTYNKNSAANKSIRVIPDPIVKKGVIYGYSYLFRILYMGNNKYRIIRRHGDGFLFYNITSSRKVTVARKGHSFTTRRFQGQKPISKTYNVKNYSFAKTGLLFKVKDLLKVSRVGGW